MSGTERKFRKLYLGRCRGASKAFISSLELIGETLGRIPVTEAGMCKGAVGDVGDTCFRCCAFILPRRHLDQWYRGQHPFPEAAVLLTFTPGL